MTGPTRNAWQSLRMLGKRQKRRANFLFVSDVDYSCHVSWPRSNEPLDELVLQYQTRDQTQESLYMQVSPDRGTSTSVWHTPPFPRLPSLSSLTTGWVEFVFTTKISTWWALWIAKNEHYRSSSIWGGSSPWENALASDWSGSRYRKEAGFKFVKMWDSGEAGLVEFIPVWLTKSFIPGDSTRSYSSITYCISYKYVYSTRQSLLWLYIIPPEKQLEAYSRCGSMHLITFGSLS